MVSSTFKGIEVMDANKDIIWEQLLTFRFAKVIPRIYFPTPIGGVVKKRSFYGQADRKG